ncbi:SMP-30/gluconolactonase/LRE family protein [Kitasatospora sp. MBT66]|uniref:SMP-30/gluconolactonase/LRE family protein n=1 Tax=Kitasatospora sp. MBT66 TaxID=1444769 RepID=UPI0005B87D89|nr:SMP-30/gluconolactonase/LRE family protein [Kitasatospora sp. MBT66]
MSGQIEFGLYEILDDRFRACTYGDTRLEQLHRDCRWAEGPLYVPAWRQLIWSDIPNDRILRWDESTGTVGVLRSAAGHSNGNTLDREGRLITCEQGNRRVTRTEYDGTVTLLASHYRGKRLNSPNDAVVRSDGAIWFSDPDFGITSDYEGHVAESEIGACNLYRIDPDSGEVQLAADGFRGPNGVLLSHDEQRLYVSDSRAGHIRVFDIREDGTLAGGGVHIEGRGSRFDNIRFDRDGRLWAAAFENGIHCYAEDGTLIGRILVPEPVSNLTFGGPKHNRLFITATTSLYSLVTSMTGTHRVPRHA